LPLSHLSHPVGEKGIASFLFPQHQISRLGWRISGGKGEREEGAKTPLFAQRAIENAPAGRIGHGTYLVLRRFERGKGRGEKEKKKKKDSPVPSLDSQSKERGRGGGRGKRVLHVGHRFMSRKSREKKRERKKVRGTTRLLFTKPNKNRKKEARGGRKGKKRGKKRKDVLIYSDLVVGRASLRCWWKDRERRKKKKPTVIAERCPAPNRCGGRGKRKGRGKKICFLLFLLGIGHRNKEKKERIGLLFFTATRQGKKGRCLLLAQRGKGESREKLNRLQQTRRQKRRRRGKIRGKEKKKKKKVSSTPNSPRELAKVRGGREGGRKKGELSHK